MARSATTNHYSKAGATIPVTGTEDVEIVQDDQPTQASLADLRHGLVTVKGGPATITGVKPSGFVTILGSLLTALKNLGSDHRQHLLAS